MKLFFKKNKLLLRSDTRKGFILPFTMLISTLVLLVAGTVLTLLSKQLYFSKVYKQSQTAYYAADIAITCAIEIDDEYQGADGLGIFPSGTSTDAHTYINDALVYVNTKRSAQNPPQPDILLDEIACAQSAIFKTASSSFATSTNFYMHYAGPVIGWEGGVTSIYNMKIPLEDGTFRCAKVTINKTPSFRQIISQGYAKCNDPNGSVERAVVNTTSE
jgi:hypothetical protein